MRFVVTCVLFFALACASSSSTTQGQVILCPAGTVLDPQKNQCVAMQGVEPVVAAESVTAPLAVTVAVPVSASVTVAVPVPVSASASASASGSASAPPPLPPPANGFAVDVRCTFSHGWVSLIPAGKYPKDESFLMQSLIGLTQDPNFWGGTEYRRLVPFAAKPCASGYTRLLAPTSGSYFLLAGEEGTFSARGAYDKNGVKRQITVNASTTVTLAPTDLTHTWLCISCPWIVFREDGFDREPFVVLANRRGVATRGTDEHRVAQIPVRGGRVILRVMEVEDETTHLEDLVLRVGGRDVRAESLARPLEIDRGKQVTLTFVVGGDDRTVDATLVASGYYDPK